MTRPPHEADVMRDLTAARADCRTRYAAWRAARGWRQWWALWRLSRAEDRLRALTRCYYAR